MKVQQRGRVKLAPSDENSLALHTFRVVRAESAGVVMHLNKAHKVSIRTATQCLQLACFVLLSSVNAFPRLLQEGWTLLDVRPQSEYKKVQCLHHIVSFLQRHFC